jgi:hypothetical protein
VILNSFSGTVITRELIVPMDEKVVVLLALMLLLLFAID